ncbi:hypothetical protein CHUAL_000025 [Chamberlinius hualienensis]
MLTPLLNPITEAEKSYNEAHIKTRVVVKNTFRIWKRRFPILAYGSRIKVQNTMAVIIATAIVHNIATNANETLPKAKFNEMEINELVEDGQIWINRRKLLDYAWKNGFSKFSFRGTNLVYKGKFCSMRLGLGKETVLLVSREDFKNRARSSMGDISGVGELLSGVAHDNLDADQTFSKYRKLSRTPGINFACKRM